MPQIFWPWASMMCKDLGIILSSSTIYYVISMWKFPINGGHKIPNLLVSFARFHDMLSPINIHVSLKLKRICCQSEHSSTSKLVHWRFGHTTHFYKPEHSNICHHFCTTVVKLAKCPLWMHLSQNYMEASQKLKAILLSFDKIIT